MCGITPLEAKAAGAPYIATATGGMVDYTNETNGWKTKSAPEMNPDFDGFNGSYAFTLAYLPCMLFSYTLMRWVYKLLYREELIITAHRFPWMDDEGREWNRMDYILSILGASLFLILPTLLLA